MKIYDLQRTEHGVSAAVQLATPGVAVPERLFFVWDPCVLDQLVPDYDAFVTSLLPLAMHLGEDIEVAGTLDVDVLDNLHEASALFHSWYGTRAQQISIRPAGIHRASPDGQAVASFYSGGVDSLFNLAMKPPGQAPDAIRYGIVVRGMDIALDDDVLWQVVRDRLNENCRHLTAFTPLFIQTNARQFQIRGVGWTQTGFGPVLGGISHLLAFACRKVLIGSYGRYRDLGPYASGPLVDRLWSSSRHSVVHYSPRFRRLEKIQAIASRDPLLLRQLRVCWKNPDQQYNCGICEKCLRTKMELRLAGAEKHTQAFGDYRIERDLRHLIGQIAVDGTSHLFWLTILRQESSLRLRLIIALALLRNRLKAFSRALRFR